jgi:CHASE3 domain sensor protein
LRNSSAILLDIAQIETSSRSFILTGDESDADAFHASVSSAERHEAVVRDLTVDNSEQQRRLLAIEALLPQKIQFEQTAMDLRGLTPGEAAVDKIRSGRTQPLTVQLKALVRQVHEEEDRLLQVRLADRKGTLGSE